MKAANRTNGVIEPNSIGISQTHFGESLFEFAEVAANGGVQTRAFVELDLDLDIWLELVQAARTQRKTLSEIVSLGVNRSDDILDLAQNEPKEA